MCAVLPTGKRPGRRGGRRWTTTVDELVKGKISLLGFELRQALAKGDTSTADGRVRVFEEVPSIMAGATSVKEREEEIPLLADRLRLTPESVSLLLQEDHPPAGAQRPAERRPVRRRLSLVGYWAMKALTSGTFSLPQCAIRSRRSRCSRWSPPSILSIPIIAMFLWD